MSLARPKDEGERWVRLVLITMGIWVALFVTMAVIPSFWLYFADGVLKWTGKFTVPLGIRTLPRDVYLHRTRRMLAKAHPPRPRISAPAAS